jgi:hypothetical protein
MRGACEAGIGVVTRNNHKSVILRGAKGEVAESISATHGFCDYAQNDKERDFH